MLKANNLFIIFILSSICLNAQQKVKFELTPNHDSYQQFINDFQIARPWGGCCFSYDMGDIDGDGDIDAVIATSYSLSSSTRDTIFTFLNDGAGNFERKLIPAFQNIQGAHTVIIDHFTSDSIADVLFFRAGPYSTELYSNSGNLNFVNTSNVGLPLSWTDLAYDVADADNDGDLDLLLTSVGTGNKNGTNLYLNNGSGQFTSLSATNMIYNGEGDIKFLHANNDNKIDFILIGDTASGPNQCKLFLNTSTSTLVQFTQTTTNNFTGVDNGKIAIGDIDNDGDDDVLIYGDEGGQVYTTKMYLNTGNANFFLVPGTPFPNARNGDFLFSDVDQDNDLDVIALVYNIDSSKVDNEVFLNNGSGSYTATPYFDGFERGLNGMVDDLNGDSIPDLFMDLDVFINDTSAYFNKVNTQLGMRNINQIGDFNGDSLVDILSGNLIYINDGNNGFIADSANSPLNAPSVCNSCYLKDFNGDSILDYISSRQINSVGATRFYMGDGLGNYTLSSASTIAGNAKLIKVEDVDNDGDLDLFIVGDRNSNDFSELYLNDGSGDFSLSLSTFMTLKSGDAIFFDSDNDGDSDLLHTGVNSSNQATSRLYINNGFGAFTYLNNTGLGGIQANDIEVADFDNDGDLDVIISNFSYNSQTTQYFINNGLNIFTSQNVPFQINRANIGVLDFNNDGYMDIIEAGRNGNFIETHFLLNDSSGNFTPIQFPNVIPSNGLLEVADFNNDGKKDFILGNKTIGFEFYTGLYINASCYNKFTNVSDTACNDYTWQQTGLVYTSSGSYFDTIPSSEGCDSILTLNLVINNTTATVDSITTCNSYTWIDGITYTNSTNNVFDTLQNQKGCDSIVELALTIPTFREVDSVSSCGPYLWINGVTYTQSTNLVFDTLSSQNGCDSIVELALNIPTFDTTIVRNNTTLEVTDSLSTYQWLDCANGFSALANDTNQTFNATANGSYAVELSKNNCVDTSQCISITTVGLGNKNQSRLNNISVYPNPTNQNLTIENSSDSSEPILFDLYNSVGQIIKSGQINGGKHILILNYPKGVYYLELRKQTIVERVKVIVN